MATLENCTNIAKTSTPNSENQKIETKECLDDLVCPKDSRAPKQMEEHALALEMLRNSENVFSTNRPINIASAEAGSMDGGGGMEVFEGMRKQAVPRNEHWNTSAEMGSLDGGGGMEVFSDTNLSRQTGGPSIELPIPGLSDTQGRNNGIEAIKSRSGKQIMVDADNE